MYNAIYVLNVAGGWSLFLSRYFNVMSWCWCMSACACVCECMPFGIKHTIFSQFVVFHCLRDLLIKQSMRDCRSYNTFSISNAFSVFSLSLFRSLTRSLFECDEFT